MDLRIYIQENTKTNIANQKLYKSNNITISIVTYLIYLRNYIVTLLSYFIFIIVSRNSCINFSLIHTFYMQILLADYVYCVHSYMHKHSEVSIYLHTSRNPLKKLRMRSL